MAHSGGEKTSLLITEQTPMACELLGNLLSRPKSKIRVVGYATTAAETMEAVSKHRPQVALISASLKEGPRAGFQLVSQMRSSYSETRSVLLLDSSDREQVVDAFRKGASGIFSRTESMNRLWKSIRSVHQGQVWANSQELQFLLEELAHGMPVTPASLLRGSELLTEREEQIVGLVAEGFTNREVSVQLGLSEHTVKNYVFKIFDKLGVSTRVELARYAMSQPDPVPRSAAPMERLERKAAG